MLNVRASEIYLFKRLDVVYLLFKINLPIVNTVCYGVMWYNDT